MKNLEQSEIEFGRWLDDCILDAHNPDKLGLPWSRIAIQLLGKSQKAVLLAWKGNADDRKGTKE